MGNICSCYSFHETYGEFPIKYENRDIANGKWNNFITFNEIKASDNENINKIIKIQSFVRGIQMRDKIKLKSIPKPIKNKETLEILVNDISNQKSEKKEETKIDSEYEKKIVK